MRRTAANLWFQTFFEVSYILSASCILVTGTWSSLVEFWEITNPELQQHIYLQSRHTKPMLILWAFSPWCNTDLSSPYSLNLEETESLRKRLCFGISSEARKWVRASKATLGTMVSFPFRFERYSLLHRLKKSSAEQETLLWNLCFRMSKYLQMKTKQAIRVR